MAAKTYIDELLSKDSIGYRPYGMVNEMVLPVRKVKKSTGKMGVFDASNIKLVTAIKGAESETPTVDYTTSIQDGWRLEDYALKKFVSDKEIENQDAPFNARRDAARFVQNLLSMHREISLQRYMQDDTNFAGSSAVISGTSQFDKSAGDPVTVLTNAIQAVADALGVPDTSLSVLMPRQVMRRFVKLADIREQIMGTNGLRNMTKATQIGSMELMEAFEVKEWIIADGHYNSAVGGGTTIEPIWGNGIWIFNRQQAAQELSQPFGFTVRRNAGLVVDRWPDRDRKGEWVRASDEWDQYIVQPKAAYFIKNPFSVDVMAQLS